MSTATSDRYTPEQVMCGLPAIWAELTGTIGDDCPIAPDMQIDEYMRARKQWDELDLADLAYDLDRYFSGMKITRRDWNEQCLEDWRTFFSQRDCRPGQWISFAELAEFISRRVEAIPLGPVRVFGKPCAAAGAFRAIERVVQIVRPDSQRFTPSAEIRPTLRGRTLKCVWGRLRWMSQDRLPPLRSMWTDRHVYGPRIAQLILCGLGAVLIIGPACCFCRAALTFPIGSAMAFAAAAAINVGVRICEYFENPIPPGFTSFRDVAKAMVAP